MIATLSFVNPIQIKQQTKYIRKRLFTEYLTNFSEPTSRLQRFLSLNLYLFFSFEVLLLASVIARQTLH